MNANMSCQVKVLCESFSALIAFERLFSCVRPHVALQFTGCSAFEFALVALVQLLSCVLPHRVNLQITSIVAGKLAHYASVGLFPRVGLFVLLQLA